MSADLLLGQEEKNSKVLELIKRQCETMLSLIDDLLISASAHTGNLNLILKNVSVEEAVSEILVTMAETIKNKRLIIILNVSESYCYCDQDRFRQIATNLISNSVKFTPQDTGPGIPKEKIETIFEPFEQLSKAYGGHGLGLSIVRALVEAHGGKVWVDSAPGKGSTFYFKIKKGIQAPIPPQN